VSDLAVPPQSLIQSGWFPLIFEFYRRARSLAAVPGIRVISWFRTPERNRIEGGDPESQHLFALAMDLTMPLASLQSAGGIARSAGLVKSTTTSGSLHIQLFPAGVLARAGITFPR